MTVACCLVLVAFGSIHSFSLLAGPLEIRFSAPRTAVSLTYSIALIALTAAVLIGPRLSFRLSAASYLLCVCGLAACGALVAGMAETLVAVWLGFGVLFGFANGLAYGFSLQIAARFNPGREGLAIGIVTAAYAFGAVLAPPLFDRANGSQGFASVMYWLACILATTGLLGAFLVRSIDASQTGPHQRSGVTPVVYRGQFLLWLGYFSGVLAGLMVIGHAVGIAEISRPDLLAWLPPTVIAACNLIGSVVLGRLADKLSLGFLLAGPALLSMAGLCSITLLAGDFAMLIGLGAVGFAYGGMISCYPAAVVKLYGLEDGPLVYGRIFTAWGSAGLFGPWLAGYLFDMRGNYVIALTVAAAFGLISLVSVAALSREHRKTGQP